MNNNKFQLDKPKIMVLMFLIFLSLTNFDLFCNIDSTKTNMWLSVGGGYNINYNENQFRDKYSIFFGLDFGDLLSKNRYNLQFNHVYYTTYLHFGYKISTNNDNFNYFLIPLIGFGFNDNAPHYFSCGTQIGINLFENDWIDLFVTSGFYIKFEKTISSDTPFLIGT